MFEKAIKEMDKAQQTIETLHTENRRRDHRIGILLQQIEDLKARLAQRDEAIRNLELQFLCVTQELGAASSRVNEAMETLEDGSLSARTHAILNSEN